MLMKKISCASILITGLLLSTSAYAELSCSSQCDPEYFRREADCQSVEEAQQQNCYVEASEFKGSCYAECNARKSQQRGR